MRERWQPWRERWRKEGKKRLMFKGGNERGDGRGKEEEEASGDAICSFILECLCSVCGWVPISVFVLMSVFVSGLGRERIFMRKEFGRAEG